MMKCISLCLAFSVIMQITAHIVPVQHREEIPLEFSKQSDSLHIQNFVLAKQLDNDSVDFSELPQILPEQAECLLEFIANSDTELQDVAEDFVQETMNWMRLVQQREEELAECNAIGGENPSSIQITQQRICRLQVESTTGVAVAISSARASLLFAELKDNIGEGVDCLADIFD